MITGGLGFLGQELCKALLRAGKLAGDEISNIIVLDVLDPEPRPAFCADARVDVQVGSTTDEAVCKKLMESGGNSLSVFHLAGIMSGQGEKDFDLALSANLDATRNILQAARKAREVFPDKVRFVFSSAGAAFGETEESPVGDTTKLVPLNTYGMTKACCELFINDFTRKGFVDGRTARLPTVVVRPGKPNAAVTSCFSGVVREPLHGVDCALPVERHLVHAVSSTRAIVGGLLALHDAQWPVGLVDRAVNLPSISITLQEMIDSLHRVVNSNDHHKLGKITDQIDPFLNTVVAGMAARKMTFETALKLGLPEPGDIDTIIRQFLEDFGEHAIVAASTEVEPSPKRRRTTAKLPGKRVAIVTGAGQGVGKAAALSLATKANFDALVLVGRRKEPLDQVRDELVAVSTGPIATLCVSCDVSKAHDVKRLFAEVEQEFGRCDLLFNNAGVGAKPIPMDELLVEEWRKVIDINVTGSFFCAREAFGLMKRQEPRGGRIINNGSVSADRPRPFSAPYTTSKHAVTGLTKSLSLDGRAHDIACGQINIGNARTEMAGFISLGALQPSGERKPEPMMDVAHIGDAVAYMAALPAEANTMEMTVMATKMPLIGRG